MYRKVCSDAKFKEESRCVLRKLKYIYVEIGTVSENSPSTKYSTLHLYARTPRQCRTTNF